MEYRYKIGEIAKIMQVPVDTLRFYEEKGIITPKRDPDSKYRYYDVKDIGNLLEYKKYRGMELSAQEALDAILHDSLEDCIGRVENTRKKLKDKLEYYQNLCCYQEEYCDELRHIRRDLYRFQIKTNPAMYYFCNRDDYRFAETHAVEPLMKEWLQYIPFVTQICRIKAKNVESEDEKLIYHYGYGIRKEWIPSFPLNVNGKHIHYLPTKMSVYTVVMSRDSLIERAVIRDALSYINRHNFLLAGDIFGKVLARISDENQETIQYTGLYFPIKE